MKPEELTEVQAKDSVEECNNRGGGAGILDEEGESKKRLSCRGSCFCGAVKFEVVSSPIIFSLYCHCTICQRLNGAPYTHLVGVSPDHFTITQGKEHTDTFSATDMTQRHRCKTCGSPVFNYSLIPDFPFTDFPFAALERNEKTLKIIGYESSDEKAERRQQLKKEEQQQSSTSSTLLSDLLLPITSHAFYNEKRLLNVKGDGAQKWAGYATMSERVDDLGKPCVA